jgi:fatty acid desaturase
VIPAVKVLLLLFAALGFAGAGGALAIGRLRELNEGDADVGMRALAFVLALFSATCTISAAGLLGVIAYGGVIVWCSYVLCAQHVGVFRIELFKPRASEPAGR